jgi:ER membrane protein complex subunit 3
MFMTAFASYFMAGFVMVKVPFPLTTRFKVMLQRGVEIGTLDPSYVSSVSWYMLVMFGMRNVIALFLGEGAMADEQRAMQVYTLYILIKVHLYW